MSKPRKYTADDIAKILVEERHAGPGWVTVREMRCGCGYGVHERSMDLWALEATNAKGTPAIAYEIKVSRSDFTRDLKTADKHRGALMFSDKFYFVAPEGVIPPEKLPPFAGLIEIHEPDLEPKRFRRPLRQSRIKVQAYPRNKCAPSWSFVVSLLRRNPPEPEKNDQ